MDGRTPFFVPLKHLFNKATGDRFFIANHAEEDFAVFPATEFEADRNGFHVHVEKAILWLGKMDQPRLAAARAR
jgi:hypothetical protein